MKVCQVYCRAPAAEGRIVFRLSQLLMQDELGRYNHKLLEKPAIVVANKIDLVKRPQVTISALQRRTDLPVLPVSAWYPLLGLGSLIEKIRELTLLKGQIQY